MLDDNPNAKFLKTRRCFKLYLRSALDRITKAFDASALSGSMGKRVTMLGGHDVSRTAMYHACVVHAINLSFKHRYGVQQIMCLVACNPSTQVLTNCHPSHDCVTDYNSKYSILSVKKLVNNNIHWIYLNP